MGQPPPVVLLQVTPVVTQAPKTEAAGTALQWHQQQGPGMSHASRTHLNIRMKQGITETEKGLAEIFTAHHKSLLHL